MYLFPFVDHHTPAILLRVLLDHKIFPLLFDIPSCMYLFGFWLLASGFWLIFRSQCAHTPNYLHAFLLDHSHLFRTHPLVHGTIMSIGGFTLSVIFNGFRCLSLLKVMVAEAFL